MSRPTPAVMIAVLLCAAVAGCGGSARTRPVTASSRVCTHASHSVAAALGAPVKARVSNSDPANIECVVSGAGISVDVVAQASAQAWEIYDATTVQQTQAYAWSTAHRQRQLPRQLALHAFSADWMPAVDEMLATNGTQTRGGSYVTVTVTRAAKHRPMRPRSTEGLALAVTRATLAATPRGPHPGPSAWP